MASRKRLPLALYRATLRWARANADVPFSLRGADVYALAPALRQQRGALSQPALLDAGAGALQPIARAAFEACRGAQGAELDEALDRGLEAVRLLHTAYTEQLEEMRATRADRADRSGVCYSVGDVVLHKKVGRRAGW